jgi:general secretion pathway protein D
VVKRLWIGCVLAVVLAMGAGICFAQELTDKQRLARGIELYNNQKYQEAVEVLQEINVENLPGYDRNTPALYIKQAQKGLGDKKSATDQMTLGEQALMGKRYVAALNHFADAKKLDYLSSAEAKRLESLVVVAKTDEKKYRAIIVDRLTRAKADDAAGKKADAIGGYKEVLAADVYLDAGDKDAAARRLAALTGAAPATVPTEVTPATPAVVPADNGLKPVVEPSDNVRPIVAATDTTPDKPVEAIAVVVQPVVAADPPAVTPAVTPATDTPAVTPAVTPATDTPAVTPAVTPATDTPAVTPAVTPATDAPATTTTVVEEVTPVKPPVDVAAVRRQAVAARVAEQLKLAQEARDAHDLRAAKMAYTRALALDSSNAEAQTGLQRVKALLGRGTPSLLEREADRISVEGQRLDALVRQAMAKAQTDQQLAKTPEDFNRSLDQLNKAYSLIDQSSVLTPEHAENLREQVKAQWDEVIVAQKAMAGEVRSVQQTQIFKQEQERIRDVRDARQRQIDSLWTESRQLVSRYKYKEAVAVLDRLLVIDPRHDKARRFRQDYSYLAGLADQIAVRQSRRRETQLVLADTEDAAIPWYPLYRYPDPKTWAEMTAKRKKFVQGAAGESEVVAATRRKLRTKGVVDGEDWSLSLKLTATGLGSVLDFIAEAARARPREINIIIDRQGIEDAGVALDDPIDLDVTDVSIEQALKMVLGTELGYKIQDDGSVQISSKDRLNENLPVRSYFVGDLITQVPNFGDTVPRMTLADALTGAGDDSGGVDLFDDTDMDEDSESGTDRLRSLIERTVKSTEPWEALGGRATLDFYERSGLMLVSQTDDGHRNLQDLMNSLRRERAIMINVESRFVTVSDAFLNDVTLDFDIQFNNMDANQWGTPAGSTNWGGNPASNVNVNTQNYDTLGTQAPVVVGNNTSNGAGTTTLLPGLTTMGGLFGAGWAANEGGMVIAGSFLDDIQLGFLIRAIQADRRSTMLFAPRITLWNGQRSWISDGTNTAYVSDLEPVVAEASVGWDPEISYMVSGAVLDVKATASADRRYVQLDLRPQVALPPDMTNQTTIVAAVPQGPPATATITLPRVQITHLMTSVSVPDGGTLLIGGLKMFEEHDVETGVPVLSKIPLLKRLFSNRAQVRGQSNMLIMVKPVIIIQAEKEEELGVDNVGGY